MQLHRILSGTSFVCGLIGIAGLAGAIETGTGFYPSVALLIVCAMSGIWSAYESGSLKRFLRERRKERVRRMEKQLWKFQ